MTPDIQSIIVMLGVVVIMVADVLPITVTALIGA